MDKVVAIVVGVIWFAMVVLKTLNYVSLTTFRIVLIVLVVLYILYLIRDRLTGKNSRK